MFRPKQGVLKTLRDEAEWTRDSVDVAWETERGGEGGRERASERERERERYVIDISVILSP